MRFFLFFFISIFLHQEVVRSSPLMEIEHPFEDVSHRKTLLEKRSNFSAGCRIIELLTTGAYSIEDLESLKKQEWFKTIIEKKIRPKGDKYKNLIPAIECLSNLHEHYKEMCVSTSMKRKSELQLLFFQYAENPENQSITYAYIYSTYFLGMLYLKGGATFSINEGEALSYFERISSYYALGPLQIGLYHLEKNEQSLAIEPLKQASSLGNPHAHYHLWKTLRTLDTLKKERKDAQTLLLESGCMSFTNQMITDLNPAETSDDQEESQESMLTSTETHEES